MRKIVDKEKPEYLGVVFDVKGPTVRHEEFSAYKAHRKPMPEDLAAQLPVLKDVLRALRVATAEYPKYEADDALASLAARAAAKGILTVIVTTDKDLLQVVDAMTSVWNPSKETTIDAASVKDVFGVGAGEVIDVLSLWGDPTDNVPGVPGIGEKTAKFLIQEFGSLDNLLRNIDQVKNPRVRERITQNRELLELSRRLVTVTRDLDIELDLERYAVQAPDEKETIRLFQELEFSSLLADFLKKPRLPAEKEFHTIFEEDGLRALAARIAAAGEVALDTETDSASPTRARLVGLSFSIVPGEAFYVPVGHDYLGAPPQIPKERALDILRPVLEDPTVRKIGQNIKYDLIVLEREGVRLAGVSRDTMVLSYLLEPNWGQHGLEKLALHYLQATKTPYKDIVGRGKSELTMDKVGIERAAPYACQDAALALELDRILWKKIEAKKLDRLYEDIERPLIGLLARMEVCGVRVDPGVLKSMSKELEGELGRLEKEIHGLAGGAFNINSPRQLADILFHKLGLPAARRTKITKGYSTSLDILEELAAVHPLARHVLDYRRMAKLKSTYADALPQLINPATGRIHTSYNQTVASTGRLSSSDPNLQNIPIRSDLGKRIREAFVPDPGHLLISADYSQIELRIMAHLSGDKTLLDSFKKDQDIHRRTAAELYGVPPEEVTPDQRREAKVVNFGIAYGMSAYGLSQQLRIPREEAQKIHDAYFARYPGVKKYIERNLEEARKKGYVLTCLGRKLRLPDINSKNHNVRANAERSAINAPMQGTAADIIKDAMIRVQKFLDKEHPKTRMILQVHDELLFETPEKDVPEVEKAVKKIMEGEMKLEVPITIDVGHGANWAEAH